MPAFFYECEMATYAVDTSTPITTMAEEAVFKLY